MTERLSQFRADLVHEGFDVLWQRGFSFPLVKLIETALLTLENMAMNAVGRGFWIGRLQRADQVQMIAIDLLQYCFIVTSPAGCENANQQPDSSQSLEASLVTSKLHDVGVKRKIGYFETFHLFFVQDRLSARVQLPDQRAQSRSDGAKIANLPGRRRACGDRARRQTFQRFPHFKQLSDIVPVQSDHHHAAPWDRFQQSFAYQLADRFPGGCAADAQFFGNGDVGNRLSGAQFACRDLALDVMVGHLAPGAGSLGCFGHSV